MATLTAPSGAPTAPMTANSSGGSWISLVFPAALFTQQALAGLSLTASVSGALGATAGNGWSFAATTQTSGGTEVPVLVVYPAANFQLAPQSTLLLVFTSVPTASFANSVTNGFPLLGVLFWNENGAVADSRTFPQFWAISAAPNPSQAAPTSALPLVATWTAAQFAESPYGANFTSDQIGRAADAAYTTVVSGEDISNNLALRLDFATQAGAVGAGAGSSAGSYLLIGVLGADLLAKAQVPFLGPQNGLINSTFPGSSANISLLSTNPGWTMPLEGKAYGNYYYWKIGFTGAVVDDSSQSRLILQIQEFFSDLTQIASAGPPPYATAAFITWGDLPMCVDGCISLPLMSLAPQPAAVEVSFSESTPDWGSSINVQWATYAAAKSSLVQIAPSGQTLVTPLQGSSGQQPVVANPFTTDGNSTDLNASTIGYYLQMTPFSGAVVNGATTGLTLAKPTLAASDFVITGSWANSATAQNAIDTTYAITAPPTIVNCTVTNIAQTASVTVVGGASPATNLLLSQIAGGALAITANAPGGPYSFPWVEASSWTSTPLPAAGTLAIFAYQNTNIPLGLYVWQPGLPPQPLSAYVAGADTYNGSFNGITNPPVLIGPTVANTTMVYYPGTTTGSTAMAALQITWQSDGTFPTIAAAAAVPIWDANNPDVSGLTLASPVVGPILVGGDGIAAPGLNYPPLNPYLSGPSPGLTVLAAGTAGTAQGWVSTITATAPNWQLRYPNLAGSPGYLKAVAANFPALPPLGACQVFMLIGSGNYPAPTGESQGATATKVSPTPAFMLVWDGGSLGDMNNGSGDATFICDFDVDFVNRRLIAAVGDYDANYALYSLQYDYSTGGLVPTSFQAANFLPLTTDYPTFPVSVGRTTGTVYSLYQSQNRQINTPVAIASVQSSGAVAPIPLCDLTNSAALFVPTLVVVEPPSGTGT